MNGLNGPYYWTIHVTPEKHCSYVSFETNTRLDSYSNLIQLVLSIFRPNRFTLSIFADEGVLKQLHTYPYDVPMFSYPFSDLNYHRTLCATSDISSGYTFAIGNWVLAGDRNDAREKTLNLSQKYIDNNSGEL